MNDSFKAGMGLGFLWALVTRPGTLACGLLILLAGGAFVILFLAIVIYTYPLIGLLWLAVAVGLVALKRYSRR